jgi:hypothetical protein
MEAQLKDLIGKTLASITGTTGDDQMDFITSDGEHYQMFHSQDCCESVRVEDICGDIEDLIGVPLLMADESLSSEHPEGAPPREYEDESFTWTFYRFATIKGSVTIRWYGSSNGYYSESVDFVKIDGEGKAK